MLTQLKTKTAAREKAQRGGKSSNAHTRSDETVTTLLFPPLFSLTSILINLLPSFHSNLLLSSIFT